MPKKRVLITQWRKKKRMGDKSVSISLPEINVAGKCVVLVDDVASTGRTLAKAAEGLRRAGAADIRVAVTHALFCGDAEKVLRQAGIDTIWSTDSIPHHTSSIYLDELLARTIEQLT